MGDDDVRRSGAAGRRSLPLHPVHMSHRSVDPYPHQVAPARRWAVEQAGEAGLTDQDAAAVLELLASELITNAVRHGEGTVDVTLVRDGATLRIAVTDGGRGLPAPGAPGEGSVTGRGLLLVAALSDTWGVEHPSGGGTCVWFTVPTTTAPAPAAPTAADVRAPRTLPHRVA